MGKKKKKNNIDEYDYSDINYNGDIRKLMNNIADSIEEYFDCLDTFAIFEGCNEEDWKKYMKLAKKLIKKLRKGDPSVFDIPELNEALATGHQIVVGLK